MIDHVNNLKLQHLVELSKLGDGCAELEDRIASWLAEHDVVFAGETIPFVLMPHFVSPGQLQRIRHAVQTLIGILNRFCDAYPDNTELQEALDLPAHEDALVRLDPGYPNPLRVCRLDAFLSGYDLRFLEFNADSPAGIGYTDVLHRGLEEAIDLPKVRAEFDTSYAPMLPELVRTLLDAYGHVRAQRPDLPASPTLAIVDVPGTPSIPEFRITCAAAAEENLHAIHGTLDQLSYDGSLLRLDGEPVHLVQRRALLEDITEGDLLAEDEPEEETATHA